jgi:hypothetical protein
MTTTTDSGAREDLARWLKGNDFEPIRGGEWFQRENVRVMLRVTGEVGVYARHDDGGSWSAVLGNAPRSVVAAVLRAAGLMVT